jgi:predicted DCC family thiol-disulfide oxidoreductase YuxK
MPAAQYLIFYDAQCQLCTRSRRMLERLAPAALLHFINVNDARAIARYPQMRGVDARGQMHVLDPSGNLTGGFDALVTLTVLLPLISWTHVVLCWAPIRALGRRLYRWLAANRYRLGGQVSCHQGACELNPSADRG